MSAAIDRYTVVAAASNNSSNVRIWSANASNTDEFDLANVTALPRGSWSNYVRGAVAGLIEAGVPVSGFDAAIISDIPLGGGLSSSASLECAMAMAVLGLSDASNAPGSPREMALAQLLQQSEQRIVGVQCGILDQFSSIFGREGHALYLCCDSLAYDSVPLGTDPPAIVVCDSGVPRELATGKYNERRTECDAALEAIRQLCGKPLPSLSHVPEQDFLAYQGAMQPLLARRARHVVSENRRVRSGLMLLKNSSDLQAFGRLMFESHQSSRDDFENSSVELDGLIELATKLPGCLGAKLSGAGWGGCTVNLVDLTHAKAFSDRLVAEYSARFRHTPRMLTCQASNGAHFVRVS
jgi:galactokinase